MDTQGAVYCVLRKGSREVRIIRISHEHDMGDEQFIQKVASINTTQVIFFLYYKSKFYLMDEKKNIRVFKQD
jgi:hypothetical protein